MMNEFIWYHFWPWETIFPLKCGTARHEGICKLSKSSLKDSATKKSCLEQSRKLEPCQPVPMCSVTHTSIEIDIGDAHVRIEKGDTNGSELSIFDLDENRDHRLFQAAGLILEMYIFSNTKLAGEDLEWSTFTTLTRLDYNDYLQNIKCCKNAVENRLMKDW